MAAEASVETEEAAPILVEEAASVEVEEVAPLTVTPAARRTRIGAKGRRATGRGFAGSGQAASGPQATRSQSRCRGGETGRRDGGDSGSDHPGG